MTAPDNPQVFEGLYPCKQFTNFKTGFIHHVVIFEIQPRKAKTPPEAMCPTTLDQFFKGLPLQIIHESLDEFDLPLIYFQKQSAKYWLRTACLQDYGTWFPF